MISCRTGNTYAAGANHEKALPIHRYTTVLHRCSDCREHFTRELDNHWTLEELRGMSPYEAWH